MGFAAFDHKFDLIFKAFLGIEIEAFLAEMCPKTFTDILLN